VKNIIADNQKLYIRNREHKNLYINQYFNHKKEDAKYFFRVLDDQQAKSLKITKLVLLIPRWLHLLQRMG
jgi:hypothetical protein